MPLGSVAGTRVSWKRSGVVIEKKRKRNSAMINLGVGADDEVDVEVAVCMSAADATHVCMYQPLRC